MSAAADDLAQLAAEADAGRIPEGGQGAAPGDEQGAPGAQVDPAVAWSQFPALFGQIVTHALPELQGVFNEAACMEWGRKMVPLADKYGWTPGAFMEWLGPWAGVAMATWPLAWPTFKAIRARRAESNNDGSAKEPSGIKPAAPASNVVDLRQGNDDPELRDPTQTNRPPRPVQ